MMKQKARISEDLSCKNKKSMKKEMYRCKDATYTIFDFENNRYDTACNIGNTDIAPLHCIFYASKLFCSDKDSGWHQGIDI